MPTTVTKSIGSAGGRDYSTVQAWEDALPASLVSGDTVQIGECYNDSEFVSSGTVLAVAGETTDATHTITLRCASGQSFKDNANVQTNALRYNASNGVGFRRTGGYSPTVTCAVNNVFFQGLQICCTSSGYSDAFENTSTTLPNVCLDGCIFEASPSAGRVIMMASGKVRNCLVVARTSSGVAGISFSYPGTIVCVGNTVVRPSDKTVGGNAYHAGNGSTALKNCAAFGFSNDTAATRFTATNCATDDTTPTSGFTGSLTYSSQFVTVTDSTRDFRLKSGSSLIDAGATDSTNGTPDIAGTARPSGSSYDIGCWEYVSAGVTVTITARCQIEFAASLAQTNRIPAEFNSLINATMRGPFDYGNVFNRQFSNPIEFGQGAKSDAIASNETGQGAGVTNRAGAEFGAGLWSDAVGISETGAGLRNDAFSPAEFAANVRSDALAPIDPSSGVAATQRDPIEWGGTASVTVNADALAPIEWGQSVRADALSPVAPDALLQLTGRDQLEFGATLNATQRDNFDAGIGARLTATMRAEFGSSLRSDILAPVEWGGVLLVTVDALAPITWLAGVRSDAGSSIDTGTLVRQIAAGLPVDFGRSLRVDNVAPIAFYTTLNATQRERIEWQGTQPTGVFGITLPYQMSVKAHIVTLHEPINWNKVANTRITGN